MEEKNENSSINKNNKYYSLAPSYEAECPDFYIETLDFVLNEKRVNDNNKKNKEENEFKNRNIAVSGGYGAGKSSIIKTFFYKSKYKKKYNPIYVTLGSYIEKKDIDTIDNMNDCFNNMSIEVSILQQILYTVEPNLLFKSRFRRIDTCNKMDVISYFVFSIFISYFVFLFYLFLNFDKTIKFLVDNGSSIPIALFILFTLFLFFLILYVLSKFNINTFKFKELKIGFEESNDNLLNKYVEELIYIFINTKYNIVVFEDIDRLKDEKYIFSKLKEINDIINNRLKGKTVQFIYAISDDLFFNPEYRTKFFDFILPIVSYSGFGNSINSLEKLLNDRDINRDIIKDICFYAKNQRFIFDIVNEYNIYKNNYISYSLDKYIRKVDKEQLLYLMAYKVLYPDRFGWLVSNKGKLSYFFSNVFTSDVRNYVLDTYEQNKAEIQTIRDKDYNKKFCEMLISEIKGTIFKYLRCQDIVYVMINVNNKSICSLSDFMTNPDKYVNIIRNNNINFINKNNNYNYVNEKEIFNNSISKEDFLNISLLINKDFNTSKLEKKYNDCVNKIKNYNFNNVDVNTKIKILKDRELPSIYDVDVDVDKQINDFEEKMIIRNIIRSNHHRFILLNKNNLLFRIEDNEKLDDIKMGLPIDRNYRFGNIKELYDVLIPDDFVNDSVNNYQVFQYLNELYDSSLYLYNYFLNFNIEKCMFLSLNESNIKVLKRYNKYFNDIWNCIKDNNLDKEKDFLIKMIYYTIKYCNSNILDDNSFFYECIQNCDGVIEYLENKYNMISKKITKFNICFSSNINFKIRNKNMIKLIYGNLFFSISLNHFYVISQIMKFDYDNKKVLQSITNLGDSNNIYKLCYRDINNFIDLIFIDDIKQSDDEEFLVNFFNDNDISIENFIKIMSCEKKLFLDLELLDSKYYDAAKENNFYNQTWKNINILYLHSNKILDDYLIKSINNNYELLSNSPYNVDMYSDLCDSICINDNIDNKALDYIIEDILGEYRYNRLDSVSINNLKTLINHKKILLEEFNNFEELCVNSDIDDDYKIKVLINSFVNLKNMSIPSMSSNLLNGLLKSDLDKKELFNFAFLNKSLFSDETKDLLFDIALENIVNITEENIQMLLGANKDVNDKIVFYFKYENFINSPIVEILRFFEDDKINEILSGKSRIKFINNDINRKFFDLLVDSKLIQRYNVVEKDKKLSIISKKN